MEIKKTEHIVRKDGIEYDRNIKTKMIDTKYTMRANKIELDEFREVCKKKGQKINQVMRSLMREYVKENSD